MNDYVYKYTTRGIYAWGRGYVSREIYDRWKDFWATFIRSGQYRDGDEYRNSIHWGMLQGLAPGVCGTLVCLGGSMYLHPMSGEMFRKELEWTIGDDYFQELKEILSACVKYVGNGAEVDVSSVPAEVKIKEARRKN